MNTNPDLIYYSYRKQLDNFLELFTVDLLIEILTTIIFCNYYLFIDF